jgi:carboxyl-terminal processing protease
MNRSLFLWIITCFTLIAGCRKNDSTGTDTPDTIEDRLKDTALAYARDIYLWNDQIPGDLNAHTFATPDDLMIGIRQYSEEPGFTDPVDHYSFGMKQTEWDQLSSGVVSDFGLYAFFRTDSDLRVRSVEGDSPAGRAGIRRGWKLVEVDGNTDVTADNTEYLVQKIYESPVTSFTFEKPDGSTVELTLNAETYQENPIYLDTIYNAGSRKAGYLVFNSFLGDTASVNQEFSRIFNEFASAGVTDVIVDLRYNGGGYVDLQSNLANYLVKSSANNDVMMNQVFNIDYSELNEITRFRKKGPLEINNVYFIVSDNTASASELLINNLKPYMNVKILGPEPTYGKPVGFFPIEVGDWYIFPVSFRSTNSMGEGNYFDGIAVDHLAGDGLDKDWGDTQETALAAALSHIGTGSFGALPHSPGLNSTLESLKRDGNRKMIHSFKGAIR